MFVFTYTAAILSIVFLAFAAFLLLKKRSDLVARYLAYHVLSVAVWVGANAAADVSPSEPSLIFWSGLALIGTAMFCGYYLCFVHAFIHRHRPGWSRLVAFFAPAAVIVAGAFSRYSVQETMFPVDSPTQIVPGVLYALTFIYLLASLLWGSVWLAVFSRRGATPRQRLQIRYMELGFLTLFAATVTYGYILPLFGELRFFNVGPQFSAVLMVCSGYAILRHQLVDFRLVIQRSIAYSMLLALVVIFYCGAIAGLAALTGQLTRASYLSVSLATTVAAVFSIGPLQRIFRRATDRLFFKDSYAFSEAVDLLSRSLNRNLDLDDLIREMAEALKDIFKVENVSVAVLDQAVTYTENKDLLDREDCERILGDCPVDVETGAGVIVPIRLDDQLIAVLAISNKLSGDAFFKDDICLLTSFSYQAAVAIEKAKLYRQVKAHTAELEAKVRARTSEIVAMREAQVSMMQDISHSLLTPLTVIKGQLSLMKRSPVDHRILGGFEESIDKISYFISRLLRLANLNAPEQMARQEFDLSELIDESVDQFRVIAEQDQIDIDSRVEGGIRVVGDRRQVEEAVLNVLGNAGKYIANQRQVAIRLERHDGRAVLTVQDSGIGIPEEDLPKIFKRFYRGKTDRRVANGSGLGLAICKRIVELHGGTIGIASVPGQGTTVTVSLPVAGDGPEADNDRSL